MDLFRRVFNRQLDLLIDALETDTQPAPLVTANIRLQRLESALARQLTERAGLAQDVNDLQRQTEQLDAHLQDLQRQLSLAEQRWQGSTPAKGACWEFRPRHRPSPCLTRQRGR